jgi:hypothetical protein
LFPPPADIDFLVVLFVLLILVIISAVELLPSYGCGKHIDDDGGKDKVDAKTKNVNIELGEDKCKNIT